MWKYIFLAITGLSAGMLVSAGIFALITSTGLMSRLAGKTHTAKYVRLYETIVVIGGTFWNVFWVFSLSPKLPGILQIILEVVTGLCQGVFIGCLAVSLAEALNATAIFARRARLQMGLSFIITAAAIGKVTAAIIQFANDWVK